MSENLVFSMSAVSTFMRCKKKYQINYDLLLDGFRDSAALEEGTNFHEIMAEYAKTGRFPDPPGSMGDVARTWLEHNTFPCNVLLIESPIYVQFLPGVYIRCTFDLAYKNEDGYVIVRDWKTFAKWPSLDADLDFQARLYIACAMKHFKTSNVIFEHVYVRRTPPYIPKDAKRNVWEPSDCYLTVPLSISIREASEVVKETQWELENIIATKENGRYSRTNLRGGGYDACSMCSVKELCKVDYQQGGLNEDNIRGISKPHRSDAIPDFLVKSTMD